MIRALFLAALLALSACEDDGCRLVEGSARFSFFITTYVPIGNVQVPILTPVYSYLYRCPDGREVRR